MSLLNSVSACSGVVVTSRLWCGLFGLAGSKFWVIGYGKLRRVNTYSERRYQSSLSFDTVQARLPLKSVDLPTPSPFFSTGGNTDGPPTLSTSRPDAYSSESRISSASRRFFGYTASSSFFGSSLI